jgi:hypothetical protein
VIFCIDNARKCSRCLYKRSLLRAGRSGDRINVTLYVHTCSGRNRISPLMWRPNTDSVPNKPVTLPRVQLLIRYAVTLQMCTHPNTYTRRFGSFSDSVIPACIHLDKCNPRSETKWRFLFTPIYNDMRVQVTDVLHVLITPPICTCTMFLTHLSQ